jgi:hypothetical protein
MHSLNRRNSKNRVAQEKPARRLIDQRGRRSRTVYRKLNKCICKCNDVQGDHFQHLS